MPGGDRPREAAYQMDKSVLYSHSREEWEHVINQRIFSERDRWLLTRRLLDGLTYDQLTTEYQARYSIPLEYDQVRRRVKAAEQIILSFI